MEHDANLRTDDLAVDFPGSEWEHRSRRLAGGELLGATVYELAPGQAAGGYHFHHGHEELLIVVRGRPTLRTPQGERELEEGAIVHFPRGPDGAHRVVNHSGEPARFVVASNIVSPDVVEYPDSRQVLSMSRVPSQTGEPLWSLTTLAAPADPGGG